MNFAQSLLWPLSVPYGAIARLRAGMYQSGVLRRRRLEGKVISVGNLTVGGTGKTPMVAWIASRLLTEGKRVGILTRGYRGRGEELPGGEPSSDEVRLLKARLGDAVALGVGADRLAAGQRLSAKGVEWFVLDDGFQHLQLERNVDIVLVDASNPFGGGHLLPAGRLREPRSALSRADFVVITRSESSPALETAVRRHSNAPIFYARPKLEEIITLRPGASRSQIPVERPTRYFAFCGIGNPGAFLADLRTWGIEVVDHRFFPDHHRYTADDVARVIRAASDARADQLICTEKDIFNLKPEEWGTFAIRYCRISMQVDQADEFWRAILSKAASGSASART
ncbi:MAG TPA: tetraacyldisaccharide 4'-kinase [Candidatus Limnocylindrales bacterium]|nr:tetraacyldisaccharide 4'-kinase [Candidatus Limnocylindrales bacterium]